MGAPSTSTQEIPCPHCGELVPRVLRCARCGMRLKSRHRKFRWLRAAAILALLGGLVWMQFLSRHREPPLVKIDAIRPYMNFSAVRIAGRLASDARRLSSGSILYLVEDGTGTLAVFSNQINDDALPRTGDRVTVSGNLNIGAGSNIRLQMRSADRVVVESVSFTAAYASGNVLSNVTARLKGKHMQVCGRVSRIWSPPAGSKAPHRIVLTDQSGSLDVVHWLPNPPAADIGDVMEVKGLVQVYNDQVQLKLLNPENVSILK